MWWPFQELSKCYMVTSLFATPNMLKKTLCQFVIWFTCSMIYYGFTLGGDVLIEGSLHWNFVIGEHIFLKLNYSTPYVD